MNTTRSGLEGWPDGAAWPEAAAGVHAASRRMGKNLMATR
jgi:hypothetical protein